MTPEAKPNPLARPNRAAPKPNPMLAHAQIWKHVSGMAPDDVSKGAERLDYVLPILGALAGDPKVTPKKVIMAASQAAADGIATPAEAVQFITGMPSDPEKLQPWLRQLYVTNMSAAVHMKAALMKRQQPVPGLPPAPDAAPSHPTEPPPTSMTPQEAPV